MVKFGYLIAWHVVGLLLVLVVSEFGLAVSDELFHGVNYPENGTSIKKDSRYDILLIGDSVLGTLTDSSTIAGNFARSLMLKKPEIKLAELTTGGLTSTEARVALYDFLQKNTAKKIIVMVGKSDFVHGWMDANMRWLTRKPFVNFRTSKALLFIVARTERLYFQKFPNNEARKQYRAFKQAWTYYSTGEPSAVPEFEKQLMRYPNYVTGIRGLVHAYYQHHMLERGIKFLNQLSKASDEKSLIKVHIGYMDADLQKSFGQKLVINSRQLEEEISLLKDRWLAHNAMLRFAIIKNEATEFANIYEGMLPEEASAIMPSTSGNLDTLIGMAEQSGAKFFYVNYPSENAVPINRVLRDREVTIYDARSWLIEEVPREKLIEMFELDGNHVSALGAQVIGERLAREIKRSP